MSNDIHVYSSPDGIKEFIKSSIESSNEVLKHYDFVIKDISSHISDNQLEATKGPTIEFLNKMRKNWLSFKNDCEMKLKSLGK